MSEPKTRRVDASFRLLFVVDIDESLFQHGSGFLAHALEQKALELLRDKKKKQHNDFHLSVVSVQVLPALNAQEQSEEAEK